MAPDGARDPRGVALRKQRGQPFSDDVEPIPESLGEPAADDDRSRPLAGIAAIEITPREQADAERAEVARPDDPVLHNRLVSPM